MFRSTTNSDTARIEYTCVLCGAMEDGGPIGNPTRFHRMKAHLREAHAGRERLPFVVDDDGTLVGITFDNDERDDEQNDSASVDGAVNEWMPERRLLSVGFLIDANCVNARQRIDALNQLEQWAEEGLIELMTTEVAQREAATGNSALRREKAYSFIFTESAVTTEQERHILQTIQSTLFGTGPITQNQRNDVEIVFNAAKYMRTLVTNDGGSKTQPGGILGNREALRDLGITIMTPEEAVGHVRAEIDARDRSARQMAELGVGPLPHWVGRD